MRQKTPRAPSPPSRNSWPRRSDSCNRRRPRPRPLPLPRAVRPTPLRSASSRSTTPTSWCAAALPSSSRCARKTLTLGPPTAHAALLDVQHPLQAGGAVALRAHVLPRVRRRPPRQPPAQVPRVCGALLARGRPSHLPLSRGSTRLDDLRGAVCWSRLSLCPRSLVAPLRSAFSSVPLPRSSTGCTAALYAPVRITRNKNVVLVHPLLVTRLSSASMAFMSDSQRALRVLATTKRPRSESCSANVALRASGACTWR